MPQRDLAPSFGVDEVLAFLAATYGLSGRLHPLPADRDQNFRLDTDEGDAFVVKIAHGAEEPSFLEAQHHALVRMSETLSEVPAVIECLSGASVARLASAQGHDHLFRVVTYLPGVVLASMDEVPLELWRALGGTLGHLDTALAGVHHEGLDRSLQWDLAQGLEVVERHIGGIEDVEHRHQVAEMASRVRRHVEPIEVHLRRQAIHGDANHHNVIVDPSGTRIVGVIDFGDMVHSWLVADLAIAAAYAVFDVAEPLEVLGAMVSGYHAIQPLREAELDAVYGLMCLRLCVSAAMAAHQGQLRPDDPYLQVSQAPLRRTLPILLERPFALGRQAVRDASSHPWRAPRAADTASLGEQRRIYVGPSLRLGYDRPLHLRRGFGQYLFDAAGHRYLDAYNNVPHVGHCHPRVVDAAVAQQRRLNTNTRYLCDALPAYSQRLANTLPDPLSVCFFVNSATEANELALRLARAVTGQRDTIVLEAGYHGHTTSLVDASAYKHAGPGGQGAPEWVYVAQLPDLYRGPYRRGDADAVSHYVASVSAAIASIEGSGRSVAAFLAETCPSVGGQIMLPPGYLSAVYARVRAAGGVCIADEVQTGFGRLGDCFYAFEEHAVVPDIVVLGKPIGNGHPLAAVVTRPHIAEAFDSGMEFFSTFGGNTVSCEVGLAVLDVLRDEGLQHHAATVGETLLRGLHELAGRHPTVGDVRGRGFFLGAELVMDPQTREPDGARARAVSNALRSRRILIGTDGTDHNVLKIRPPMPFDSTDADHLLQSLDDVLTEVGPTR